MCVCVCVDVHICIYSTLLVLPSMYDFLIDYLKYLYDQIFHFGIKKCVFIIRLIFDDLQDLHHVNESFHVSTNSMIPHSNVLKQKNCLYDEFRVCIS